MFFCDSSQLEYAQVLHVTPFDHIWVYRYDHSALNPSGLQLRWWEANTSMRVSGSSELMQINGRAAGGASHTRAARWAGEITWNQQRALPYRSASRPASSSDGHAHMPALIASFSSLAAPSPRWPPQELAHTWSEDTDAIQSRYPSAQPLTAKFRSRSHDTDWDELHVLWWRPYCFFYIEFHKKVELFLSS